MNDLKSTLEARKDYYIEKLKELVAIDTHDIGHGIDGGLEKAGQDYMVKLMRSMGADDIVTDPMDEAVIRECFEKHKEGNLGHDQTDRHNVYASFKGKKGGKSLLFNSHIDVMPADEADGWITPPYQPDIRDGKMYGRGTADMKAGLMASVMAIQLLKDAGCEELPGDVIITSVCDEEGGGNGSMQAVMRGQKADGVIVCESSSSESLIVAHMGWVFFKVDFEGKSCHSGGKRNGVNAIEKAIKVIQALNEKEHEWLLTYKHPLLPPPNLNIGVIEGGSAGSTVPGECSFSTCVHFIPGQMTYDQVVDEFKDVVNRTARSDPWMESHPPKITIYQAGNGFEMDPDNEFITTFREAYRKALDKEVVVCGTPCGNDARLWKNIAGCPTAIFGPGRLAECHGVNEWVSIEQYLNAILVYANLILEWCGQQ